jgi:hypothetical protein
MSTDLEGLVPGIPDCRTGECDQTAVEQIAIGVFGENGVVSGDMVGSRDLANQNEDNWR